jgi:hypothetical protein
MTHFVEKMDKEGKWESLIEDLTNRRTDPYTEVEKMMASELKDH